MAKQRRKKRRSPPQRSRPSKRRYSATEIFIAVLGALVLIMFAVIVVVEVAS